MKTSFANEQRRIPGRQITRQRIDQIGEWSRLRQAVVRNGVVDEAESQCPAQRVFLFEPEIDNVAYGEQRHDGRHRTSTDVVKNLIQMPRVGMGHDIQLARR